MSKAATELAARATRIARRQAEIPQQTKAGARAGGAGPRTRPVRVTTDLSPRSYRSLLAYCAQIAERSGRARVPHTEVIRALVDQLEADDALRAKVAEAVHNDASTPVSQ